MIEFITKAKHNVLWAQPYPELGIDLTGHRGVTRVLSHGEMSFVERLAHDKGISLEKAKELASMFSNRGTAIHADLEADPMRHLPKDITDRLGTCVASEVMCWGTFGNAKIYGFIDAIWQKPDGNYILVDYKTKNRPIRYAVDERSVTSAYTQMSVYAACVKQCYGVQMDKLAIVFLFMDKSGAESDAKLYQVNRKEAKRYLNVAFGKVQTYSEWVGAQSEAANVTA